MINNTNKNSKTMITTKRFETAVNKLYKAFNEGTLDANKCEHCAVGNLCDTEKTQIMWHTGNDLGEIQEKINLKGWGKVPTHKDYTSEELFEVERLFLLAHQDYAIKIGMAKNVEEITDNCTLQDRIVEQKEAQFEGLMAVINYLAELDNIEVPQITVERFKAVLV